MTERTRDIAAREVAQLVERLFREYGTYCLGENADPEGFVERLETQLESIRLGGQPDPIASEAIPLVLERIALEAEGRAP